MKLKLSLVAMLLLSVISFGYSQGQGPTYPPAKEGFKKIEINFPAKKNESILQVELYVGKNLLVDLCNNHFLLGELKEEILQGWGYMYYEFTGKGDAASTLMGCPTNEKKEKLVTNRSQMIRYNSKVPLVVYVPNDFEVHYKVWSPKKKIFKFK